MVRNPGILIEHIKTFGWEGALRGMRNPMNSWDRSDTVYRRLSLNAVCGRTYAPENEMYVELEIPLIGPKDMMLLLGLTKNGREHRKAIRQVFVSFDLTVPILIWSEFDTYKIGFTRNSCSTMHKLGERDLVPSDFGYEWVNKYALEELNELGEKLRAAKKGDDKDLILEEMKHKLPSGFLQKATIATNYEALLNMYKQRKKHRLRMWNDKTDNAVDSITNFIRELPYMDVFIRADEGKEKKKDIMKSLYEL
jgi:hypothetical protein